MTSAYITHASTPEQLQAEVCSDIRRRIAMIEDAIAIRQDSKAEQAKLARAVIEFKAMLHYWENLTVVRTVRKRK